MRSLHFALFALMTGAVPLAAQSGSVATLLPAATSAEASTRLRYAARLPIRTTELRNSGVHDTTIHRLLEVFRQRDLAPGAVDSILLVERDAARENGPTDNFGAFVQTQLAAGKRGRALAAAIHEEHRRHGHKHDAEHARKQKAKDDRDAARERARERERVRHEGPDRPMVNPRQP